MILTFIVIFYVFLFCGIELFFLSCKYGALSVCGKEIVNSLFGNVCMVRAKGNHYVTLGQWQAPFYWGEATAILTVPSSSLVLRKSVHCHVLFWMKEMPSDLFWFVFVIFLNTFGLLLSVPVRSYYVMDDVGGSTRKTISNLHGSCRSRYFSSIKNYFLIFL